MMSVWLWILVTLSFDMTKWKLKHMFGGAATKALYICISFHIFICSSRKQKKHKSVYIFKKKLDILLLNIYRSFVLYIFFPQLKEWERIQGVHNLIFFLSYFHYYCWYVYIFCLWDCTFWFLKNELIELLFR